MMNLDQLESNQHRSGAQSSIDGGTYIIGVEAATNQSNNTKIKSPKKRRSAWKEFGMFAGVMAISAVAGIVFTNLHLFQAALMEDVLGITNQAPVVVASTDGVIVNNIIEEETVSSNHFYMDTKDHLKYQLASNALVFNTLPPDNRVIIEDLGVDAPIVDLNYYTPEKLENGDFKEELERGVVRYPNTGTPDHGNMLIFGHTSDYRWNNNEYGQIFRSIPKLQEGQIIKIIRNNQMYTYKIIAKKIVKPKDVAKVYEEYHSDDQQYLTLVGCYPIGTANERIAVIAELVGQEDMSNPAVNGVQLARFP